MASAILLNYGDVTTGISQMFSASHRKQRHNRETFEIVAISPGLAGLLSTRPILRYHPGMDQIDIYRSAVLLIKRYGEDAAFEAAARADGLLDEGDLDGQRVWKAIIRAIENIQCEDPEEGERLQ